jgi:hypothetical protein
MYEFLRISLNLKCLYYLRNGLYPLEYTIDVAKLDILLFLAKQKNFIVFKQHFYVSR